MNIPATDFHSKGGILPGTEASATLNCPQSGKKSISGRIRRGTTLV
jgi:hypothetical protein